MESLGYTEIRFHVSLLRAVLRCKTELYYQGTNARPASDIFKENAHAAIIKLGPLNIL